ncbi:metallophosphoesterase family protein [Nocardia sp. CDC160]|uniref:metallophosphoesterase family protein n=1 Tax=Nocardia sp. CDC160 TaxID=3112166 RepID=UPI002DB9BE82|nr:metallophosphoesterase [Nocardia sp. CDC160]MEC3915038.1 metallophosphoesterase [Nocardia sp. CDC160]
MSSRVGETEVSGVRIAAVGDLHMRESMRGRFRPALLSLGAHADVLLLAGDLTNGGTLRDTDALCAEIEDLPVPVVAVLGNHDHDRRLGYRISVKLNDIGVHMLDGTAITLLLNGIRLGIAGVMGGSGGFPGHPGNPAEGSMEHRQRFLRGPADAARLRAALESLDCDMRVALMHFAPVVDTLVGENPKIYPGLGCQDLAAAVDAGGAVLAIHGHAHGGTEFGRTPGGVEVRNVSYAVIRTAYRVYEPTHGSGS